MKITEIELLALLENLRIMHPNDDYILRVAPAIVAECFGYCSRACWTEKVRESGLVEYGTALDRADVARKNYGRLIEMMRRQGGFEK